MRAGVYELLLKSTETQNTKNTLDQIHYIERAETC